MVIWIGIILILFGLLSILWGDKDLKVREGIILRIFSWPKGRARWLKWLIGIALIYVGLSIIFHA